MNKVRIAVLVLPLVCLGVGYASGAVLLAPAAENDVVASDATDTAPHAAEDGTAHAAETGTEIAGAHADGAIEKMDAHQLAEDRTIVRVGKMTIPVEKTNSVSYVVADFALKVESFELAERYKRVEEATRIRDSLLSAMSLAAESNVLRGVAIDSDALAALIRDLLSKEHAGIDDVMFVSLYKQDLARL